MDWLLYFIDGVTGSFEEKTHFEQLKGVRLLPIIKRVKTGQPTSLKEYARVQKDVKTEGLGRDEIAQHVLNITGEELGEILQLADRDDTIEEARWVLHCIILYANEYGQPSGQNLSEPEPVSKI